MPKTRLLKSWVNRNKLRLQLNKRLWFIMNLKLQGNCFQDICLLITKPTLAILRDASSSRTHMTNHKSPKNTKTSGKFSIQFLQKYLSDCSNKNCLKSMICFSGIKRTSRNSSKKMKMQRRQVNIIWTSSRTQKNKADQPKTSLLRCS